MSYIDKDATLAAIAQKAKDELADVNHYFREGVQLAVDVVEGMPEQRWIPCSERLPEKNCRCLTTNTAWGAFEVDFNVWINGEWLYPNEKPIAWMPLPEPYKKGEEHE